MFPCELVLLPHVDEEVCVLEADIRDVRLWLTLNPQGELSLFLW